MGLPNTPNAFDIVELGIVDSSPVGFTVDGGSLARGAPSLANTEDGLFSFFIAVESALVLGK